MKLHDSLDENIAHLEEEIVLLEGECILIAQDVARELIDKFNYWFSRYKINIINSDI